MATLQYASGVIPERLDGNLITKKVSGPPVVMIAGTASKGVSDTIYTVTNTADAVALFGTTGTLVRGMYEALSAGAENVALFRIGTTPAKVTNFAGSKAVITTGLGDDEIGNRYGVVFTFDDSTSVAILKIWDFTAEELVYSNDPSNPIDTGDVSVTGSLVQRADALVPITPAIGTDSSPAQLSTLTGYVAGTDGTNLSKRKMYEALEKAYALLLDQEIDIIVPMDVYLDDYNVIQNDGTFLDSSTIASNNGISESDVLGRLYKEEYQGELYFWWDTNNDNNAEEYPGDGTNPVAGLSSSTMTSDGTTFDVNSFKEVNFAHQLANFCYNISTNDNECIGVIGVRPPESFGIASVAQWVGKGPTKTVDVDGNVMVTNNGTGLLGNKFVVYTEGNDGSGTGPGFFATSDDWLHSQSAGETILTDRMGYKIDIGKYISLVTAWPTLFNSYDTTGNGYIASGACLYAGLVSFLPSKSAPTNKVVKGGSLRYRISKAKLDSLAGARYVAFSQQNKGMTVFDAPTASLVTSDYNRLTTVRIITDLIDDIRAVADPFLGEGTTPEQLLGLKAAIETKLEKRQTGGYISRFSIQITQTPAQRTTGTATALLVVVPAFELRRIQLVITLSAA